MNSSTIPAPVTATSELNNLLQIIGGTSDLMENILTNNANYTGFGGNGSRTGTFAGQGAITQPLSNGPGY